MERYGRPPPSLFYRPARKCLDPRTECRVAPRDATGQPAEVRCSSEQSLQRLRTGVSHVRLITGILRSCQPRTVRIALSSDPQMLLCSSYPAFVLALACRLRDADVAPVPCLELETNAFVVGIRGGYPFSLSGSGCAWCFSRFRTVKGAAAAAEPEQTQKPYESP